MDAISGIGIRDVVDHVYIEGNVGFGKAIGPIIGLAINARGNMGCIEGGVNVTVNAVDNVFGVTFFVKCRLILCINEYRRVRNRCT